MDLKGYYKGTVVEVETDPELYRAVAEKFPEAWLEDPDLTDATREVLKPHWDRLTYDAPLHSLEDVKTLAPERAINSKPSRFGSLEELLAIYAYCEEQGLQVYGGGQGEVGLGRGQIQYLASLYHPDTPNDTAPAGLQRPRRAGGDADQPDGPGPLRDRLSLGLARLRLVRASAAASAFFHALALPRPDIRLRV